MTLYCDTCGEPFKEGETIYQTNSGVLEDGDFIENGEVSYHHEGC